MGERRERVFLAWLLYLHPLLIIYCILTMCIYIRGGGGVGGAVGMLRSKSIGTVAVPYTE